LPCIFIRNQKKDYGTAKQLEGVLMNKGDPIVTIVEDVATTGGQALEAAKALRDAGRDTCCASSQPSIASKGARENVEREGLSVRVSSSPCATWA
jgi:orotate phosphoribosyltransferase